MLNPGGGYSYGPSVPYRLVERGPGPEVTEQLDVRACPSCGASWVKPGLVRPGHAGGREYMCATCGVFHRGDLVDDDGEPLATPGAGLARREREASNQSGLAVEPGNR